MGLAGGRGDSHVHSVLKALRILDAFTVEQPEASLAQLSSFLGMPRSTTHRLVRSLELAHYLEFNSRTGKYRLGLKVLGLGSIVLAQLELVSVSHPFLERLAASTGETVNLGILDGSAVIYIDKVDSREVLRTDLRVGTRLPIHCTALGKLLLAFLPEERAEKILSNYSFQPSTVHTILDPRALQAELQVIRQRGYAYGNQEFILGAQSVGVPIRDFMGKVVAGISVAGPTVRFTEERREAAIPLLLETARQISERLGYRNARAGGF